MGLPLSEPKGKTSFQNSYLKAKKERQAILQDVVEEEEKTEIQRDSDQGGIIRLTSSSSSRMSSKVEGEEKIEIQRESDQGRVTRLTSLSSSKMSSEDFKKYANDAKDAVVEYSRNCKHRASYGRPTDGTYDVSFTDQGQTHTGNIKLMFFDNGRGYNLSGTITVADRESSIVDEFVAYDGKTYWKDECSQSSSGDKGLLAVTTGNFDFVKNTFAGSGTSSNGTTITYAKFVLVKTNKLQSSVYINPQLDDELSYHSVDDMTRLSLATEQNKEIIDAQDAMVYSDMENNMAGVSGDNGDTSGANLTEC
jgi:hypothetical protein